MSETTRDQLVTTAVAIMTVKGFNNTGIAQILAEVNVPKGSFYHYFKSKDDLGFAIIEHYGQTLRSHINDYLQLASGPALVRLRSYFAALIGYFAADFSHCNCLLGNLAQELALQNPDMRKAIYGHYAAIEQVIAQCLAEAKREGALALDADENRLAKILFSSWEGCLVRAKLEQSTGPLQELLEIYFSSVLKPGV